METPGNRLPDLRAFQINTKERERTMTKVNTLTPAGVRLLAHVEKVSSEHRTNDAVVALAEVVRALVLNTQPLWALDDPDAARAIPAE